MSESSDPIFTVLKNYLTREGYRLDPKDLKLQLGANPDYPSIKSITDTFDYFGVENVAVQVPISALFELPDYFLTTIQDEGGPQVVEVFRRGQTISIKGEDKKEQMSADKFKVIWSGMVLAIEPKAQYHSFGIDNRWLPVLVGISLLVLGYINVEEWHQLTYVILSLLGGWFSYMAVREGLGMHNQSTAKICNSDDLKTNCSEVISSDSSRVFGVKLTDASVAFFVAVVATVILMGVNKEYFALLSLFSVLVVAYSVYAQAFVQKVWCPLCLGIGSTLILMSGYSLWAFEEFSFTNNTLIYGAKALAILGIVFVLWLQIFKVMVKLIDYDKMQIDYARFKRNPLFFNHALGLDPIPNIIELKPHEEIWFGNENASLVITGITNPFCGHCKTSFDVYDEILSRFPNQVKVRIVFYVSPVMDNPDKFTIPGRIVELYQQEQAMGYEALRAWYSDRDVAQWKKRYGMPKHAEGHELLERHLNWSRTNGISYTPMTVLNGFSFPKEYEITDLPMLLPDMLGQEALEKVQVH